MASKTARATAGRRSAEGASPVSAWVIFALLLVPRLLAAQHSIIGDCDEVYNYWEPTHYLVHGTGFQTWEYSPVYAIRSWTYIAIHAIVVKLLALLQFTKVQQFYGLRACFALVSTGCETLLIHHVQLYKSISEARILFALLFASAGMFTASTAFLPSTFAMYGITLAQALSLRPPSPQRTTSVFTTVGITAIISWPFAVVLAIVFALQDLVQSGLNRKQLIGILRGGFLAIIYVLSALAFIVAIDSVAYRRFQIVPLNIVLYNVFSGPGRGPNIFGTEPWWYYVFNLLLLFNIGAVAAFASLPLTIISALPHGRPILSDNVDLLPVYLWIGVFIIQPHKEERFMYVIFPLICYNAARAVIAATRLAKLLFQLSDDSPTYQIIAKTFKSLFLLVFVILSLARVLAQWRAYTAPMHVYKGAMDDSSVCLGKEWYRFPSSFFLPDKTEAFFVKSEFSGLLPGKFPRSTGDMSRNGTWIVPSSMNDQNLEEPSHTVPIDSCDFMVDSDFPLRSKSESDRADFLEPRYSIMRAIWSKVECIPFLDAQNSAMFGRSFWLPGLPIDQSFWGEYCMLKRVR